MDEAKLQQTIGKEIRTRRQSAGITQQDLASQLGLTRASVSNIEAGNQSLSVIAFLKVAAALEVAPADLLGSVVDEAAWRPLPAVKELPDRWRNIIEAVRDSD